MKRRLIILLVAVILAGGYKMLLVKPGSFELSDLQTVRQADSILKIEMKEDNVLVFWGKSGLAVDYFKPSLNKWKWINGASHSGDYHNFSYQYLPKAAIKDCAVVYGLITNEAIDQVKIQTEKGSFVAEVETVNDKTMWYVVLEKEEPIVTIRAFGEGILIEEKLLDNQWLLQE